LPVAARPGATLLGVEAQPTRGALVAVGLASLAGLALAFLMFRFLLHVD
jgi:hypothetical protein